MTPDPLKDAIETTLQELRTQQEATLRGLRESVLAAAAHERQAAISEARVMAEAVAAERLEEALAKARADADEALAAAEAIAAEKLSEALAETETRADRMREAAETAAAERLAEAVTEARAGAVAEARADAERTLAESRTDERHAALDCVTRLLETVRDFDRARSLSEVLDALVIRISQDASRVVVLLVQGDHLRGWRAAGFDDAIPDARSLNLPLRDPTGGVVLKAIRIKEPCPTVDKSDDPVDAAPAFASLAPGRIGLAVPVEVGGRIVAVVYADDEGAETPHKMMPSAWPELVEVLARHAARCLEALTAVRAGAVQVAARREDAPQGAGARSPEPARTAAPADQAEAARRYAKLLVSEIRLYHEAAVTAGRRERNLLERLGSEIERARGLYNARVPPEARADYFNQELVRTLADGDPALLGSAS